VSEVTRASRASIAQMNLCRAALPIPASAITMAAMTQTGAPMAKQGAPPVERDFGGAYKLHVRGQYVCVARCLRLGFRLPQARHTAEAPPPF
jgi:hypothetical protein